MSKFIKGQRVRVIEHKDNDSHQRKRVGHIGTVTSDGECAPYVNVSFAGGKELCFCQDKLVAVSRYTGSNMPLTFYFRLSPEGARMKAQRVGSQYKVTVQEGNTAGLHTFHAVIAVRNCLNSGAWTIIENEMTAEEYPPDTFRFIMPGAASCAGLVFTTTRQENGDYLVTWTRDGKEHEVAYSLADCRHYYCKQWTILPPEPTLDERIAEAQKAVVFQMARSTFAADKLKEAQDAERAADRDYWAAAAARETAQRALLDLLSEKARQ